MLENNLRWWDVKRLCNQFCMFTRADSYQQSQLQLMVQNGAPIRELSIIIWICSDARWTPESIAAILQRGVCA